MQEIKFDPKQEYQLEAIEAVIDLFKGQPMQDQSPISLDFATSPLGMNDMGFANQLVLSDDTLAANIKEIQKQHKIEPSEAGFEQNGMNFSVEMETGTGKTYVYLRSIFELNKNYGFKKFIIVVPTVAIREGVKNAIDLTKDHFKELYDNTPINTWVYDSKYASRLREFASSNQIQILIINIDAFNKKDIAVIHSERDQTSGHKPIEFIQSTNPVVILDEPQNMETEVAKEAIQSLNPLCTLRYSATHRNPYNLLYRLGPVKAYDLGLVKRIEVDSVLEDESFNQPYILVESIKNTSKSKIVAKLKLDVETNSGPSRKTVNVDKNGIDLYDVTGRESYRNYIVEEINSGEGYITFSNGVLLQAGQSQGDNTDDRMRIQVRETVKEHFAKEKKISKLPKGERIKVLSLFFIDKVANYRTDDGTDGKLAKWFVEAYEEFSSHALYKDLEHPPVDLVHDGYFARDKKGKFKDSNEGKRENQDDRDAYSIIMQNKKQLLSFEEPMKFIFSHSALREGWDNPNVFQICTLNESHSELKKRQEIGRGLRLPVRENGERSFDPSINRLTVIANESYEEFAKKLQTEIEEETGEQFTGRIKNKKERKTLTLVRDLRLDPDFKELWSRIKHRTRFSVKFDTGRLIDLAAEKLSKMDEINIPKFSVRKGEILFTEEGLEAELRSARPEDIEAAQEATVPDLIGYLQSKTELTRATIAQILIRSGRLGEVTRNPQQFLDQAHTAIQSTLQKLMVDGIKYEKLSGDEYEMMLFEQKEIETYLDKLVSSDKSIFDYVEFDSDTERKFAEALNGRDDIKLYFKLPRWFKIKTPLGNYNPDWAIVKEDDQKLYLVRETKGTEDKEELRSSESMKIDCGKAHFDEIDVDFDWIKTAEEV